MRKELSSEFKDCKATTLSTIETGEKISVLSSEVTPEWEQVSWRLYGGSDTGWHYRISNAQWQPVMLWKEEYHL